MGTLYIVATPIGNLEDMTPRAVQVLKQVSAIACEDTRRTHTLLCHFHIPRPAEYISYRQGNEERTGRRLCELLQGGADVALCSDGGYPGISDPGYRLVRSATQAGLPVQVIPGASAVHVALVASGLPTSSYTFKGYPPRRWGEMCRFFAAEKDMPHTLVLFESPMRVAKTLNAALEVLGNREAAVCLELTKLFERVVRGSLADLAREYASRRIKGEVTLVIAGNNPKFRRTAETVERGGDDEPGDDENARGDDGDEGRAEPGDA